MDCIFGLFDILGYRNFCTNGNEADMQMLLRLLDAVDNEVMDTLNNRFPVSLPSHSAIKAKSQWIIFSDTIFVSYPIPKGNSEDEKVEMAFFIALCLIINKTLFEAGFPLRGVIHRGNIITSEHLRKSIAGKSIVEAYDLEKKLKLSVTVFTDEAIRFLNEFFNYEEKWKRVLDIFAQEYDVSSEQNPRSMHILRWKALFPDDTDALLKMSITDFVNEKFRAHGKSISDPSVIYKIKNTIKMFEHWRKELQI